MCGIAGYVLTRPVDDAAHALETLLGGIRHRGRDDEGFCLISRASDSLVFARTEQTVGHDGLPHISEITGREHDLALLNTRFAIIDPTPAGHQPFSSRDGSIVAVFNGEIYNHLELRSELESAGVTFRTGCDTEALVEGYAQWGDALWERLNGFWAVALYDRRTCMLTLCRDRLGIAPLYLRETPDGVYFASAIEPLRCIRPATSAIEKERVQGFIETSLKDFDRWTLFSGIESLPPATVARWSRYATRRQDAVEHRFWDLPSERLTTADLTLDDAVGQFRDLLFSAVELRLRADVDVAFELSGGLDSSSIVAAAATIRGSVATYTIEVPEHNEEPYARTILQQYPDIDYRVLREPERDFMDRAEWFAHRMEEPFHSPNIYTHFEMRQRMKAVGVDVVISGAGGDEVLAGYEPLFWPQARNAIRADGDVAALRRHEFAMHMRQLRSWPLLKSRAHRGAKRLRRLLATGRPWAAADTAMVRDGGVSATNIALELERGYASLPYYDQRAYHFETGLLPYYLRSNDVFSMAIPIEQRLPFLDYRLVELGMRMPPSYLFREGWTKYVLRRAMQPYLPPAILWRRDKMGFPFAYQRFLRANRERLLPTVDRARGAGLLGRDDLSYDTMLRADPIRLWRICSTGLWLSSVNP
jgi:asparagine synthase (glutamine-hydrolysing)